MRTLVLAVTLSAVAGMPARAEEPAPEAPLEVMPVREVTAFKDGHAFVLRKGSMPVDEGGHVVLDRLPTPVLGTFWPFCDQANASLRAVRAGAERVAVERTALDLVDLLAANVGASVILTDLEDRTIHGKIRDLPTVSAAEAEATASDEAGPRLPQRGRLVLLDTMLGVRAIRLDQIREVVFEDDLVPQVVRQELRNRLTLELQWTGTPSERAEVGMMYLESGLRWIPGYRVDLQSDGTARVRLQATLVNDLTDLDDVTVNLVIGVPTFAFAHLTDPISMQQTLARVAAQAPGRALTSQFLSNAIMTQAYDVSVAATGGGGAGEDVPTSDRQEDLYVFQVRGVTLGKGQRLVLPVAETTLPYEDLYTLEVPFSPPPEVWPQIVQQLQNNPQEAEAARLLAAPKVMHEVRLTNEGPHPLTTAPALVLKEGRVLAQGMLTYTSVGGSVDLPVTNAVDIHVRRADREVERTPNAVRWRGDDYARIDMAGTITLTNYKEKRVRVEVTRFVLGTDATADQGGETQALNALEDMSWTSWRPPIWWRWYNWPYWWYHFNGVAQIRWEIELDPSEAIDLGYTWAYYWR
ncbi:MAG: hypothetical protein ACYTG6_10425 [Planctomycetota bacterium]|jgi:hypothetical protein